MVGGWDDSNGMNPWLAKENIIWEIKVIELICCIHHCKVHLKR